MTPVSITACGSRWRALAHVTAGGFAALDGDSVPARVAGALAAVFDGSAVVFSRVDGDDALVIRSSAGNGVRDLVDESLITLAQAAVRERHIVRGVSALAAPLRGREGPIG